MFRLGSCFQLIIVLLVVVDLVAGQICPNGCIDKLASGSILSCSQLKLESGCETAWMEKFCQCSCGYCESKISNFQEVQTAEDLADEAPCECQNSPPAGSTYTCAQFKNNNQCDILLTYGFCECECGKCKGAKNIIYILPAEGGSVASEGGSVEREGQELDVQSPVQEPTQVVEEVVNVENVQNVVDVEIVGNAVVGVGEGNTCPLGCTDVSPDEAFTCPRQKLLGKCSRTWMQGYCQCSCGTCSTSDTVDELAELPDVPETTKDPAPTPTRTRTPTPTPTRTRTPTPTPTPLSKTSTDIDFQICTQSCNENPPPKSEHSCEKQAELGKCSRTWMTGFCECTCGTCDILQEGGSYLGEEQKSVGISRDTIEGGLYVVPQIVPVASPQPIQQISSNQNNFSVNKDGNVKINILHFNDLHARLQPTTEWWWECEPWRNQKGECFGGVARIKTIVDQTRAEGAPMLLLNGGDDFVGTSWDYHDPTNKATAHFLNRLGVDAMVLGNHEFDHGPDNLLAHVQQANYPVLSCNMDSSKKPQLQQATQKYTIKQVAGLRVGIFGLTTTYTNNAAAANPYPVWFSDTYQAANDCVRDLKSQGVQLIIALSHNGYNFDKHLAKKIRDIDIVVGAHSHTFLAKPGEQKGPVLSNGNQDWSQGEYPTMVQSEVQQGKRVPVVQAGWASRYMGKLTVEVDTSGNVVSAYGQPILLGGSKSSNNVPEDQEFVRDLENWKWW